MKGPPVPQISSPCRIGIVGLGTAGRLLIPAIRAHSGMTLAAVADPAAAIAVEIGAREGVAALSDIESLVARPDVDAVYVATPTQLHAAHVRVAAAAGKHILCEKPMAASLAEAQAMIAAADAAGVVLMIGHSRSFDAPFHHMRALIEAGEIGRVRMILQLSYTDWVYRPRRPEELDPAQGGGVTYRQGAHQFDVIRLLGGGMVESVSASAFDFDPGRPTIGAHNVTLRFADGAIGTAIYNGYGTFSTAELGGGIDESGFVEDEAAIGAARRAFLGGGADEAAAKRARAARSVKGPAPHHPMFGLTLASGELGDLRQAPDGLYRYGADGRTEIPVPLSPTPRDMVVAEFHDAVAGRRAPLHDGRWGLANLEICEAALAAARTGREIRLRHQVSVPSRD